MSNEYYSHGSYPATAAAGASSPMRTELDAITAGFNLMPILGGNGSKAVIVNSGANALTVTAGTLALAGNFATTGAFNTTLVVGATVSITLPIVSGLTLATLTGTEELTNKTLTAAVGKGVWTASGTWTLPAHTLGGTVSGGGNQINNVIIGNSSPLAGSFTTLTTTSLLDISGAAAGQIKFPATQNPSANANTLDDYEEGTWTPADGSGAGLSLTVTEAVYTKIGNTYALQGRITYPATADGSNAQISGVPFAAVKYSALAAVILGAVGAMRTNVTTLVVFNSVGARTNTQLAGTEIIFTGQIYA